MLNDTYYGKTSSWGMGVVEDIRDPEQAGRVRVRIYGIHTPDKALIPTEALPWSQVVMPVSSASQSGVGTAPVGVQVGSLVYGNFLDSTYQQFLVLGTVPGKKASTDVQVVESETSVNTAPVEEFGLSASEQVYNIARAEGLSENMAAGLLAAISDNADFTNLFDQSSDRFSDYSEFALGLLSPLEDLKTQTLYVVKKISGVTFFEAAVPGGGRTQKPISSPGDAATAISQQFYGTVSEELKTYADQANAAYGSSRTEGNEGIYQASAGAEEDSEFPYLRSVEHIISYFQHGRDSRINTDNRIKGLWISATHFEGDDENNRRVPFYDAEFQKLTGRGVQTHLYILRDGSLQTGLHIEEVPNDNIIASERVTEAEPERLRDFAGTLFNLGGGETGNDDNLDFDRIFEQTLIDMLKDYRADGNPIPTLTSGTRTAEEQAIIRGQVDFAAGRNLSRHERYQAVDFREVDTRRMEEGGYLDRYDLWRRYKDNGDPYHIEERGAFRDPPEEWPFPATSTITRSIQNSVLTINFVGMRRVGASGYTTAQWETFEALIQAYLLVFPEGNWVSSNLQYPIKGHIDSRYSDYSGVASEIEQPAALAAAPVEAQDPTVEESLPSEEPETAALPTDTSDVEAAPSGPITLPTLDPLNFPSIPSPDDTGIISIGDLLGGGSGGTATGGNADTLNNQAGSYYLDFNNFTNLPSPTLTVTGDATGTATFNSLGDATLNLTVSGGGTLNATGTPVDNQVAVWTAADTLEGDGNFTWDGATLTVDGTLGVGAAAVTNSQLHSTVDATGTAVISFENTSSTTDDWRIKVGQPGQYDGYLMIGRGDFTIPGDIYVTSGGDFGTSSHFSVLDGNSFNSLSSGALAFYKPYIQNAGISKTAEISFRNDGSNTPGYFTFSGQYYDGTWQFLPDILSLRTESATDARIGMGTGAPANAVHLLHSNPTLRLEDSDGGYAYVSGNGAHVTISADAGNTQAGSRIAFEIDGAELMRLDHTGDLTLGGNSVGFVTVSSTAPSTPSQGHLWWDTDDGTMFIYYDDGSSAQWVDAVPVPDTSIYATINSPALTGTPTAPTATTGTNTTQIATTAFVQQELSGLTSPSTANTITTNLTTIYEFPYNDWHGGEFVVTVHDTTNDHRQISKLIITHDGTTAYGTEYARVETHAELASLDVDVSSGQVRIRAAAASSNSTNYVIQPVLLAI